MSRIKIVCTSTGCLDYAPEQYEEIKKKIDIIRIHMFFQGKEYLEGIGFDPADFYRIMENVKDVKGNLPHTGMPTHEEVAEVFERWINAGYDKIIVIALSSYLGGTWNFIRLAAKEYQSKAEIVVVDAKITCFQEGQLAIMAQEMVDRGCDVPEILQEIEWRKAHQEFLGVDEHLDYLILNGRLKGGKAFMGKAMNICPVVHFNHEGELTSLFSAIGANNALKKAAAQLVQWIGNRKKEDYLLYRTFTGQSLVERQHALEPKFEIVTNHPDVIMSCVTGINVGPWIVGYAYVPIRRADEELPPVPAYYYEQTGKNPA